MTSRHDFLRSASLAGAAAATTAPWLARARASIALRFSPSMPADDNAARYGWSRSVETALKAGTGERANVRAAMQKSLWSDFAKQYPVTKPLFKAIDAARSQA